MTAGVAHALGLGDGYRAWLESLAAAPVGLGRRLPERAEEDDRLAWLGVDAPACVDVLATRDEVAGDDAYGWLLDRCQGQLVARAGDVDGPRVRLPQLPEHLGAAGQSFPIHLFLAALPTAMEYHRRLGVPAEVSRATFSDLARHVAIHRRISGRTGVDAPWWVLLHLRGVMFECGRLQYGPCRLGAGSLGPGLWYDETEAQGRGPGWRRGDGAVSVHIPEGPGLVPEACDAADGVARELFATCLPELGIRIATCTSWLLDDQLAGYLPEESNIVRFQRRFELVPGWRDNDGGLLEFVFRVDPSSDPAAVRLDDLPQTTTLERAALAHLRSGHHWRDRTGWYAL